MVQSPDKLRKIKELMMKQLDPNNDGQLHYGEYERLVGMSSGARYNPSMSFAAPYMNYGG